jgi:hypothetical protein
LSALAARSTTLEASSQTYTVSDPEPIENQPLDGGPSRECD